MITTPYRELHNLAFEIARFYDMAWPDAEAAARRAIESMIAGTEAAPTGPPPGYRARMVHWITHTFLVSPRVAYAATATIPAAALAVHYDFSDIDTLWQNTAGTTPITADGQEILRVDDKSGNDYHSNARLNIHGPTYRPSVHGSLGVAQSESSNDGAFNRTGAVLTQTEAIYFIGVAMATTASGGTLLGLGVTDQDNLSFHGNTSLAGRGTYTLTDNNDADYGYSQANYIGTPATSVWHIYEGWWLYGGDEVAAPSSSQCSHDGIAGTLNTTMRGGPIINGGLGIFVRIAAGGVGSRWPAYIGEVQLWDGIPADDQKLSLRTALQSKWSTPAL